MGPVSILGLALAATSSTSVGYILQDEPGAIYVMTEPTNVLGFMAHRHVIEARSFTGRFDFDPENPGACTVRIDVPVMSLVVDRPEMRKAVGFEKEVDDGQRKTIMEHMLGEGQLHVSKYPRIRFRGHGCARDPLEKDGWTLEGTLEVHGVKAPIEEGVRLVFEGDEVRVSADFSKVHADFGMEPYTAFLGTIKNDERIEFKVRARGVVRH